MKKRKKSHSNIPRGKKQKDTKYQPTLAQKKLLEVLLNPEHRLKTITEICNIADIERVTYYRSFENENFCKLFEKESKALIRKAKAAIINSSIRQAVRGDAAHTKLLLTMSGDYADRTIFPDGKGKPQSINPAPTVSLNFLERATRIAFILQKAIEYKKKVEESEKKQGDKEKQGS